MISLILFQGIQHFRCMYGHHAGLAEQYRSHISGILAPSMWLEKFRMAVQEPQPP
jgi:hypothetical protein